MNEENELELKLWLSEQLPDEIFIQYESGDGIFPSTFWWKKQLDYLNTITPREWDYVARRVEEKLTHGQHPKYMDTLGSLVIPSLGNGQNWGEMDPHDDWFYISTAPWQTRAKALRKVVG